MDERRAKVPFHEAELNARIDRLASYFDLVGLAVTDLKSKIVLKCPHYGVDSIPLSPSRSHLKTFWP